MLKTLEEPPEHVKFILATTDPQKIPVTVLSRCLQFNLKQMPPQHIVGHLSNVLTQEGVPFEAAALQHIAKGASGSMRDALSLLDQAIAHGAGKVEEQAVRDMLGTVGEDYLYGILDGLAAADLPAMLAVANNMDTRSLSFEGALQELASLVHRIALVQMAPSAIADEVERARLTPYGAAFDAEFLQLAYQILTHGRADLPLAPDEYAGFTMTLLRLSAFKPVNPPALGLGTDGQARPGAAAPVRGAARPSASAPAVAKVPTAPVVADVPAVTNRAAAPQAQPYLDGEPEPLAAMEYMKQEARGHTSVTRAAPESPLSTPATRPAANSAAKADELDWHAILENLDVGGLARSLAQHCEMVSFAGDLLRLRLAPAHRQLLLTTAPADKLQAALSGRFGRSIRLQVDVEQTQGETPAQRMEIERQERFNRAVAALEQDGFVREVIDIFDATLHEPSIKSLN